MKMYAVVAALHVPDRSRRLVGRHASVVRPVREGTDDARGLVEDVKAPPVAPPVQTAAEAAADAANDAAAWIVAIATRADRTAYACLFRAYAPKIKGHLVARGAAAGIADELTQEVMLTVWRKAAQFDASRGTAAGWLFAITRNRLVNHVRDARYPLPELEADDARAPERPDDQLAAAEQRQRLARALAALPPEQRAVLGSAYFRGQTLQEHAAEQQLPLGTVKTRVRLALGRLRAILAGGGEP
jgi:RNA polymerase sigma-70 factor (ECF subfamily)